jgi:stage II sporulation protein D
VTRSAPRWRSAAAAAALALTAACASSTTVHERFPPGPHPIPRPRTQQPADSTGAVVEPPADSAEVAVENPSAAGATSLRVGLAVDTDAVTIGSTAGMVVRDNSGRQVASANAGSRAIFALSGGSASLTLDGARAGTFALPLTVSPNGTDGLLSLGNTQYRGQLVVQPGRTRGLTAVNRLDMESYLQGVVPSELGTTGSQIPEAAKAQAVAARTYAVRYLGRRAAQGFDVLPTVADQVYGGVAVEVPAVNEAVRATRGEILAYAGQPILAYYHSTCAGRTAAIDEVWNEPALPYLRSVVDVDPATGQAYDSFSSRFHWTERWTAQQLTDILNRTLADSMPRGTRINQIRDVRVTQRTQSGRVARMVISTDAGSFTVGKDRVRWILLTPGGAVLNSAKFDVSVSRDATGAVSEVVADGGGWGHGIGMCQVGAMGRARAGQDYRTILAAYYRGAQITRLY